jgi:cytochrome c oxidase subunit 4
MSHAEAEGHGPSGALDEHSDGQVHAHIGSLSGYVAIFFGLICLTLLTVGVSNIHLGAANLVVAVVIASIKASFVILFFMHLRYDSRFYSMIIVVSVLFIGVFFAYTMNDTTHRGELDLEQGVKVLPSTGEVAPGGVPAVAVAPAPTPETPH